MSDFTVLILVDWSNICKRQIADIISSVLSQIAPIRNGSKGRCEIRLYGGWDEDGVRSRDAQAVIQEISQWNLEQMNIRCSSDQPELLVPIIISKPELAETLLADKAYRFQQTYRRKRPASGNIRIVNPETIGCTGTEQDCFLKRVERFLDKQNECPGCTSRTSFVHTEPLCYRNEQKMVDTMLSCDIVYAVTISTYKCIVLISEDDDFVPVLRQIVMQNHLPRLIRAIPRRRQSNNRPVLNWRNLEEIEV
jgi:hypothetical protein